MSYTASATLERLKLKGWVSTSSGLSDAQILDFLNDSLRSYVVPFLKSVRDEWFVSGTEDVTPDANARVTMPDSVASTIRSIWWLNNGQPTPLVRVEPENSFLYEGQNASNIPYGFMLRGYGIQILPTNVGSVSIRIDFMERPAEMVLEEDAGEVETYSGPQSALDVTLVDVPITWQESTPASVDWISSTSPFSTRASGVEVVSLVGNVLTLNMTGISDYGQLAVGDWFSDINTSPYPNIPIELHPLLQRHAICELYTGLGDKRLEGSEKKLKMLADDLRRTLAPRTQGSARPIINRSGPGMRGYSGRWGW